MRRILPPVILLVGFSLGLTACNRDDTYSRPYTWHPTHANDANIAAEVADPSDLVIGRGSGSVPASAVLPGGGSRGAGAPKGLDAAAATFGAELGAAMGTGQGGKQ